MQSNIIAHGVINDLPKPIVLNAGTLRMAYEGGFISHLKIGKVEIVRMINHMVRDHNWGTVPMVISNQKIESGTTEFFIEYEGRCKQGDVDFLWKCSIEGKNDSSITFKIDGKALTDFRRNRIGFTVLHPIETCAGKDCTITHSDSLEEVRQFPVFVSPTQPFFDIKAMAWKPADGINAMLCFEGDIFETEDQRNWIDSSYKTYCTPLSEPFPKRLKTGDEVSQTIRLQVLTEQQGSDAETGSLTFHLNRRNPVPFPKFGISLSTLPHTEYIIAQLQDLPIDYVRIALKMNEQDPFILQQAVEVISKLKCSLEIALFVKEPLSEDFIQSLVPLRKSIVQFIILPLHKKCTDEKLINESVPQLRKHFPKSKIGGGTDAFFAELNRERTPTDKIDFLTFSVNPQVHAFDIDAMTKTLAAHKYVVESCKQFAGQKDIHVGPVTLKMRWNPNATGKAKEQELSEKLPEYTDLRQLSLYGAVWTLGSFKYLAESQVSAITYFQTCGWAGLMPHPNESWPSEYLVFEKSIYPMYLMVKEILKHKKKSIVPFISSKPTDIDGVAFVDKKGEITIVVANFTNAVKHIEIPVTEKITKAKIIDASTIQNLVLSPSTLKNMCTVTVGTMFSLQPFGFAILE